MWHQAFWENLKNQFGHLLAGNDPGDLASNQATGTPQRNQDISWSAIRLRKGLADGNEQACGVRGRGHFIHKDRLQPGITQVSRQPDVYGLVPIAVNHGVPRLPNPIFQWEPPGLPSILKYPRFSKKFPNHYSQFVNYGYA